MIGLRTGLKYILSLFTILL